MSAEGLHGLMPGAAAEAVKEVESRMVERSLAAGDVVVRAEAPWSSLCLVQSGALRVTAQRDGVEVALNDITAGDWTGEVDILSSGPAAVTLVAAETTIISTLDSDALELLVRESPVAASALVAGLSRRLAMRLRTATVPALTTDASGAVRAVEAIPDAPADGWVARLVGRLFGGGQS